MISTGCQLYCVIPICVSSGQKCSCGATSGHFLKPQRNDKSNFGSIHIFVRCSGFMFGRIPSRLSDTSMYCLFLKSAYLLSMAVSGQKCKSHIVFDQISEKSQGDFTYGKLEKAV